MNGELYINGRLIDINQAVPFPFTYNISDVKDLSSRKGNKSKTITLPGTANNCALMATVYLTTSREKIVSAAESQFLDFDPTIKSTCQYYDNGLLVFEGIAQLLQCKCINGVWSFEISMISNQIDYIALMKKIKINELNFDEYNHSCDITQQSETWTGFNRVNNVITSIKSGANWLGLGYYYGLIDYGYTRVAVNTFRVDQITPSVFVYGVLKKLFAAVGLTFQSTFFETQRFKKLLVAYYGGTLPTITSGDATAASVTSNEINNAGGFIMNQSTTSATALGFNSVTQQIFQNPTVMVDNVDVSITSDPSTQTLTTSPFKFKAKSLGIFNIEYNGSHIITLIKTPGGAPSVRAKYLTFFIVKKNNVVISYNQIYTRQTNVTTTTTTTEAFTFLSSINLLQNDELSFEIKTLLTLTDNSLFSNTVNQTVQFKAASSTVVLNIRKQIQQLSPGNTIRINQFLPDMTGDVFFKGIITMFNLYLRPKTLNPTIIEIEPLNDFYGDSNSALDWSYLVDRSKEIKVTPTTNLAAKVYNFQFENQVDLYNDKYLNDKKEQYGSFLFDTQNQYATTNTDLKVPFAQVPLVLLASTTLIMPRTFQIVFSEFASGTKNPTKGKPFIVQLGALRTGTWNHRNGSNVDTVRTTYPYVGHLDSIDTPTFDLNFGVPQIVYYTALAYTNSNLYSYHETFIKEIVSRYGKLVTLNVMLNSSIINQLDFKKLILIDGVVYRLQKINDFDPGKEDSTQIELIRILQGDSAATTPPETFFRLTEAGDFREMEENNNLRITE